MNKAKFEKLGRKLILVVAAEELFEITYCTDPNKPEDCKTEHKTWDMCSEQERSLIYSQCIKDHIKDQEIMLDEVITAADQDIKDAQSKEVETSKEESNG